MFYKLYRFITRIVWSRQQRTETGRQGDGTAKAGNKGQRARRLPLAK